MSYLKKFKHGAKNAFHRAKHWARRTRALSKILSTVMHQHPILRILHSQAVKHGYGRRKCGGRRHAIQGGMRHISFTRQHQRAAPNIAYSKTVVNKDAGPIYQSIAYANGPQNIPKLSVDLRHRNNALGLAGNWKE